MQTIQQEIYIPENHHLNLNIDIPKNIPTGLMDVCLIFQNKVKDVNKNKQVDLLKDFLLLKNKNKKVPISDNIDIVNLTDDMNNALS